MNKVLVRDFLEYQNMKCFGTPRANQNSSTKTCFSFSHKPKCQQKLALLIGDKNSQKIAYWYKTYTRQKKRKSFGRLQALALQS
jgi:hypothetical protein